MGCPFDASIKFGFTLTKSEAKKITKELEKLEANFPEDGNWEKEVGDFEPDVQSDENEKNFFLELSDVARASNCDFVSEVSEKKIEKAKKEAENIYDKSPFLAKNFKKENIKLLLIANYVG